jgi:hypothetical protein
VFYWFLSGKTDYCSSLIKVNYYKLLTDIYKKTCFTNKVPGITCKNKKPVKKVPCLFKTIWLLPNIFRKHQKQQVTCQIEKNQMS